MYQKILIPLENSKADRAILDHIRSLGKLVHANLLLMHVADGWVARNYEQLKLAESDEMKADRAYLEKVAQELRTEGFVVDYLLAMGEPADEIVKFAHSHQVDLIAMSTHGHRFLGDLLLGNTADKVRHQVDVPVLLLKAKDLS
jgi:nucleotide-binding universal stress UspA family protein